MKKADTATINNVSNKAANEQKQTHGTSKENPKNIAPISAISAVNATMHDVSAKYSTKHNTGNPLNNTSMANNNANRVSKSRPRTFTCIFDITVKYSG